MKKLLVLAAAAALVFGLVSCGGAPDGTDDGVKDAGKVYFEEGSNLISNSGDSADLVFSNATASYKTTAKWSGGGYFFKIGEGEKINLKDYSKISIDFDYAVDENKWTVDAHDPKWCINVLNSAGTKDDNQNVVDTYVKTIKYIEKQGTSASMKEDYELDVEDDFSFDYVCIKLNAYKTGNADTDTVSVTIKKIEFVK